MKRKIISMTIITISMIVMCFSNAFATMSTHTSSISYPAGGYGYSSPEYKSEAASQYSTRLTGVGFIGLPAGQFPNSTTNIYFTPVDPTTLSAIAGRNYHNKNHMKYNTVKHDDYYSGYTGSGFNVELRAESNYTATGNTVGVKWNLGYVSALP